MDNRISALQKLKDASKFSNEMWEKRGLNPSPESLCLCLEKSINDLLEDLVNSHLSGESDQELDGIFESHFKLVKSLELDTEEFEFVTDYFDEIAKLLNIDSSTKKLNLWTLGSELYDHEDAERRAAAEVLAEERERHEILSVACPNCCAMLETFILERDNEIPSFEFDIIRCVKCHELTILDKGSGIKKYRFLNYELIAELPKDEYDLEKALIKLEQLKEVAGKRGLP